MRLPIRHREAMSLRIDDQSIVRLKASCDGRNGFLSTQMEQSALIPRAEAAGPQGQDGSALGFILFATDKDNSLIHSIIISLMCRDIALRC